MLSMYTCKLEPPSRPLLLELSALYHSAMMTSFFNKYRNSDINVSFLFFFFNCMPILSLEDFNMVKNFNLLMLNFFTRWNRT